MYLVVLASILFMGNNIDVALGTWRYKWIKPGHYRWRSRLPIGGQFTGRQGMDLVTVISRVSVRDGQRSI